MLSFCFVLVPSIIRSVCLSSKLYAPHYDFFRASEREKTTREIHFDSSIRLGDNSVAQFPGEIFESSVSRRTHNNTVQGNKGVG